MTHRRRWLVILLLPATGIFTWLVLIWLAHQYDVTGANYSLIEPGLYVGGLVDEPPPGTSAVLNLCETADPYQCAMHVWEPTRDSQPAPDVDWLRRQVAFIRHERDAGRTVFVHCRNGVSRSGMVVVAYLMAAHGWSRDETLAAVRLKRPEVRPNPAFMDRLTDWEQALAADGAMTDAGGGACVDRPRLRPKGRAVMVGA